MDLDIECQGLKFTDHSRTVPPAAAAALKRGILGAWFIIKRDGESSLQPELAIMESCGIYIESEIQSSEVILNLARSTPEEIEVMRDVRRSTDLPFSSARLSNNTQRLAEDSYLEHALQQQAWHAEFKCQSICDADDDVLEGPGILLLL